MNRHTLFMPQPRLVGLFLFGCLLLNGQPRYRYDHLVTTAKLWNAVRFTHPWLYSGHPDPRKPAIDWDRALQEAVRKILYAQTQPEVYAAWDAMYASLGDPATALVRPDPRNLPKPLDFSAELTEDGVLVIRGGGRGIDPNLRRKIHDSISVVIDLRRAGLPENQALRASDFVGRPLGATRVRELRITGLPFEGNLGIRPGSPPLFPARDPRARYIVFLADRLSTIPDWAIAMHALGKASIVGTDAESEYAGLPRVHLYSPEAWVRSGDYVYPDGSTGGYLNRRLANNEDPIDAAIGMALTGAVPPAMGRFPLPPAKPFQAPQATPGDGFPRVEQRIHAAIQIWGVFEYFFPYKGISGDDWTEALREELQRFEDARDAREYHQAVARLVGRARDPNSYATSLLLPPPPPQVSPRRTGPVFAVDAERNGYADLTRLEDGEVPKMWDALRNAATIYFDLRGPVRTSLLEEPILSRLVDAPRLKGERSSVMAFHAGRLSAAESAPALAAPAGDWSYRGKTIGLIDERTAGESERAGLRLEAANGTRFAGPSPSAGAAGTISTFGVAGGITVRFTSENVRHWDGRRLQRVGLQPDVKAPAAFLNAQ